MQPEAARIHFQAAAELAKYTRKGRRRWLCLLLLAVSILTTLASGARFMDNFRHGRPPISSDEDLLPLAWAWHHPAALLSGWPFSATLLTILLAHELGHLAACRRHGIDASWPFVLPAPSLSGTAGAVIRIRSRIPSRTALMDVGISGPIAGFALVAPALAAGLWLSTPLAADAPPPLLGLHMPLAMVLLHRCMAAAAPGMPPAPLMAWHPVLIAAWVGLFITALNLIPAGQLDGGHVLYALSPTAHRRVTRVVIAALFLAAILPQGWAGWLLWALILLVPAMRHPAVSVEPPLDRRGRLLGWAGLTLFALTFVPAPFEGISLLDFLR